MTEREQIVAYLRDEAQGWRRRAAEYKDKGFLYQGTADRASVVAVVLEGEADAIEAGHISFEGHIWPPG